MHIIPNSWHGQTCRSSELWAYLEREPVRLATTKTIGFYRRDLNPNDFKHSLTATIAGFKVH